ncbi:MAG: signal peptide peptidase SppA, partial [Nanohaloarchaea archaeon QH_8_44_6]
MKHSKLKIIAGFLGLFVIFTASVAALSLGGLFQSTSGDAALLKLSGTITPTSSGFASSGITPEQVRDLNQKVRNGGYDAVVYEINSGGGSVVASKEIKRAIDNIEVPTVCRFRDISASGGYMIAMGCDRIVADSATITGSIGVTSSYLEYSGAMDKIGVEYVNISAGKYKQVGSPFTNTTEQDKEVLQDMAVDIQDEFIDMVDKNRNLTQTEIEEVQTAKIFLGQEARNLSLVDSL